MTDYNVDELIEDSTDGTSYNGYEYGIGVHGVNTNYPGDTIPRGGDTRLHVQGAFTDKPTKSTGTVYTNGVHFEAEGHKETLELGGPLPTESNALINPTLTIGFALGPIFSLGFASIDIGGTHGFSETCNGEINYFCWDLISKADFPTPQEKTTGVSFNLNAESDASEGYQNPLTIRSTYSWRFDSILGGGTFFSETDSVSVKPEIFVT